MLVFQGVSEKSIKLNNWIMKEYSGDSIAVLDTVGAENVFSANDRIDYFRAEEYKSAEEVIEAFESAEDLHAYKWLAFYGNFEPDELNRFRLLDAKIPNNIIVTIQDTNGLTRMYFE